MMHINKMFVSVLICFALLGNSNAQTIANETKVQWKGFERTTFTLDGIPAFYVSPKKTLPGNPWIWQAHFPDWHTQIDSILLERGFHVAYINTNDLYGHPKAMMIWDNFYDYLTKQKSFSLKPALEGVSRGGLYVYGWAKRNPTKVSCIYAEGPVCDFKSWPGGKGKGKGAPNNWEQLKKLFGFTEEQALAYNDQPLNNLEGLASFRIPVLHIIGLKDSIVPNDENTFPLVHKYIRLGGSATVVPMPRLMPYNSDGHHYYIDNPEALADFVFTYAAKPKRTLASESFIKQYGHLSNVLERVQSGKEVTVAFLGGSITNMEGWRQKTCQYLTELFPSTKFNFINAGIPSLGSLPHVFRMESELLNQGRVDLLFVESAVNDFVNHTPQIQQRRALEGVIRNALKSNPLMNIVMMAFVDEFKLAEYKEGKIPFEVALHDTLANYYHLPFINLAKEVNDRIAANEFTWGDDFKNLHPSAFGQEIYFNSIKTLLRKELLAHQNSSLSYATKLPKPLQKLNYENGHFIPLQNAKKINGFSIDPSWHPTDKAGTRQGFVDVPMLIGTKPGQSFEFEFTGTAVGITIAGGPDAGKIYYSIDGKDQKTIDLFFEPHSAYLHMPQYILLGDDLKNRKHVLKVTISEEHNQSSKGNAVRIVHLFENK